MYHHSTYPTRVSGITLLKLITTSHQKAILDTSIFIAFNLIPSNVSGLKKYLLVGMI